MIDRVGLSYHILSIPVCFGFTTNKVIVPLMRRVVSALFDFNYIFNKQCHRERERERERERVRSLSLSSFMFPGSILTLLSLYSVLVF